jgi:RHS repeat-associated protein
VVAQRCGSRIDRVRTAAWGNQTATGQNGSAIVDYQIYGYTGGITDPIDGLLHLGHRWYDSHNGRFTQRDDIQTLADPGRANRYQYAASNPVNYADPSGESAGCIVSVIAAVGTAALIGVAVGGLVGAAGAALSAEAFASGVAEVSLGSIFETFSIAGIFTSC